MNSSGIKRGLAGSAVAALAVTGLPFLASSASATTINDQVEATGQHIAITSQGLDAASVRFDGQDNSVRLEAGGDDTVTNATFYYAIQGVDVLHKISTVTRNDDGAFSFEWTGAAGLVGTTVDLYVASTDADGYLVDANGDQIGDGTPSNDPIDADGQPAATLGAQGSSVDENSDVSIAFLPTVNVNAANQLGVFQSPYGGGEQWVAVNGTTSALNGNVTVGAWVGTDDGDLATSAAPVTAAPGAQTGTFGGKVDIAHGAQGSSYSYSTDGSADELILGAYAANPPAPGATDDNESVTLYRQTITSVTATTKNAGPNGGDVTVTVLDQNGKPVAGARVAGSSGLNNVTTKLTDSNGQAKYTAVSGTGYFYADATSATGYQENLGDQKSADVTLDAYNAAPSTLVATSHDGAAFDFDEYNGTDDISVQVQDQRGSDFDTTGQDLNYYWTVVPFDSTYNGATRFPATGTSTVPASAENGGQFNVPLPNGPSGTYTLHAGLTANPGTGTGTIANSALLTVKAGEADIVYDQDPAAGALAGTSVDVTGDLELEDGTPLPNRSIKFTYNSAGDAGIVQASGTTTGTTRTVKLDEAGKFSVTIKDKAVANNQPTETGALVGETVDSNFIVPTDGNDGDADADETLPVIFAQANPPAGSKVTISAITDNAAGKPGVAVPGSVTVKDANGGAVANQVVMLTVDGDSFFTNGDPAETPEKGDDVGNLKNLGQTLTTVTDNQGVATFAVAVGRSVDFDDDGLAEDIVTATAGSVSDTEDVDYDSSNPLNGGEVQLEFSPESEQDAGNANLPQAMPGTEVAFDVYTTDQFGNRVGGETVQLSDNTNDSDIVGNNGQPITSVTSNFDDDGDFYATSNQEDEQTVKASWTTETNKYPIVAAVMDDNNTPNDTSDDFVATPAHPTQSTETLTDTQTVNWKDVVVTDATVTMTASPSSKVPVGTAVTETVTVLDDQGNPVPGAEVRFTKSGPGNTSDDVTRFTNDEGKAFYVVNSSQKGDAVITAVVQTGGTPVVKTDTVTFKAVQKRYIALKVRGKNLGNGDDRVFANAKSFAEGLVAKVYAHGEVVAQHKLNDRGNFAFVITDTNGKKSTKYTVRVAESKTTKAAHNSIYIK